MLDILPLSEGTPGDLRKLTAEEYRAGYPLRVRPTGLLETGPAELRFYRDAEAWAVGIHYAATTRQLRHPYGLNHGVLKISPVTWDVLPFEGLMDHDGWISESSGQMRKAYIIQDALDYAELDIPPPTGEAFDLADLIAS
ncbi:hypothetical protein HY346_02290 [Candidatus Microgenomates bacterium]|nr:hypothetical protein [Candidatus Microgenomates bacterium]